MLLEKAFLSCAITVCANAMRWFSISHLFLYDIAKNSRRDYIKFIALLLCFPCFKLNQFCFEAVYFLNQTNLRRLCGEDLFLKLYGKPISLGGVRHVIDRLRHIKHRLESANPAKYLANHGR